MDRFVLAMMDFRSRRDIAIIVYIQWKIPYILKLDEINQIYDYEVYFDSVYKIEMARCNKRLHDQCAFKSQYCEYI